MDRACELALVDRLRAGDADAFDDVSAAFNTRLFTFLVRVSRRREVAEDLLEEVWMRLVRHGPRLQPDTRLGPWLFTVARNLHVSYVRSRMLEDSAAVGLISLWAFSLDRSSPFEETAAHELERRLERALATLPVAAREVLLLGRRGPRAIGRGGRLRHHTTGAAPATAQGTGIVGEGTRPGGRRAWQSLAYVTEVIVLAVEVLQAR